MKNHKKQKKGSSNLFSFIIAVLLLVIVIKLINGDGKGPEPPTTDHDAVCLVVGNVENSPAPNLNEAKEDIEGVFDATPVNEKPNICMYSATSDPRSIEIDQKYIEKKSQNHKNQEKQKERLMKGINEAATSSPSEGGADYYEAILKASGYLSSTGAEKPLVIVYGSGLSDSGMINFAFDNILSKKDTSIKDKLSNSNIRKDGYDNINLIWYGAGQPLSGNQQESFSEEWKNKTGDIYKAALGYVGIDPLLKEIKISSTTKSVATNYTVNPTRIPGELKQGYKLSLNSRIAKFEKNTATLLNYDEVEAKLEEFAASLNADSSKRVKLTGYQTECGRGTGKQLSIDRATTIRNILVNEFHIDSSRLIIDGVDHPQDDREEIPRCGDTGVAVEHRTVILEVL